MSLALSVGIAALAVVPPMFGSLADAMRARSAQPLGDLSLEAIQYIVHSTQLGWTSVPLNSLVGRNSVQVFGYASPDRRHCLLVRAQMSEWGQYGIAEYALIRADSGLAWVKQATIASRPVVSDRGTAAIFNESVSMDSWPTSLIYLFIFSSSGDTLLEKSWPNRINRPMQRGMLAECYAFSPGGEVFVTTMNTADPDSKEGAAGCEYNHTDLFTFDLRASSTHDESLGPFWPKAIEWTPDSAVLRGEWRRQFCFDCDFKEGFYRLAWSPWHVTKRVTRTVHLHF